MVENLLYGFAWVSFGAGHSLLAARPAKTALAGWLGPWYRIAYNLFAVVHLGIVVWLGTVFLGDRPAYVRPVWLSSLLVAVQIAGWVVLIWAAKGYDLGRLGGWRNVRDHMQGRVTPEDEPLRLDGLHRYVRHPLYLGLLLILWGRVGDPLALATAVWGSAYLVVGSWFEERKLLRIYGDTYRDYRVRVPAFLPWRVAGYDRTDG